MKKLIENFVGTSDKANVDGLGYPYSLNIMTEDTGEGKSVQRVLKTVNGQVGFNVSNIKTGTASDYSIGEVKLAFTHGGWIWVVSEHGIFRCKQTNDPSIAGYWELVIPDETDFTNYLYKHCIVDSCCFIADFTKNKLLMFSLDGKLTLTEVLLPKRKTKTNTYETIVVSDICSAYGYALLADKNSNHIYYSIYDFRNLMTDEYGIMQGDEHLFDGYWDYDENVVKVRDNGEGQWFEQTAYDGDMRMLISLDGTLYGVSTGYMQRYSYNSSTTEPFTPDLNGVTHLKFDSLHSWLMHTELEGKSMLYAQDDDLNGGLYILAKDSLNKVSTVELDTLFADQDNEPFWLTSMLWAPNHKLFGAYMMDNVQGKLSWAVYDLSTKDWHWRDWMPVTQLGGKIAFYSDGNGWSHSSDYLYRLTDVVKDTTIVRQGGAIWNGGDNFIADRCEIQTSYVDTESLAMIQWAWDNDSFNEAEPFSMFGTNAKCAIGMGMGRMLTVRFIVGGLTADLTKPLTIRALKLSYRPADNFLGWC